MLDSSWAKQVYICAIPEFNQMYTASDELITGRGVIDSAGYFTLKFSCKQEPLLYRLHVIKKSDPASTLIIGGKDENFVFFIAKAQDYIYLKHINKNMPLSQNDVQNTPANKELARLFSILNYSSNQKVRTDRERLKNQLIDLADSSSSQLVSLLAISNTFGLSDRQKERIANTVEKFNRQNPYGANIFEQYKKTGPGYILVIAALLLIVTGVFVIIAIQTRKKNTALKIFKTLSQRETTIIKFIADGKSNKEIAAELNVELSTVKTHVNNIYTKLNVKGRKDVLAYKALFKKYGL